MATLSIDCPLMAPGEYDDETELRRDQPGRPLRSWPELTWHDEAGTHKCAVTGRTTLGSAPGAQVRIADREVSRLHAELEPTDRGTWVRDLGSRNGTFVDNLQVAAAMLPDGAHIRVGRTDVVLRYPPEASPVELWPEERFGALIGASTPMRELFAQMSRVAHSDAPALILGETGTGKELVARAIHDASARGVRAVRDRRLRRARRARSSRASCSATRAARSPARSARAPGRSRRPTAARSSSTRSASCRSSCSRSCCACSSRAASSAWARASTGRSTSGWWRRRIAICARMVNAGAFREDLYFRVAVLPLALPPLRGAQGRHPPAVQAFPRGPPAGRAGVGPTSWPRCPGSATCASCAISSSAPARSAARTRCSPAARRSSAGSTTAASPSAVSFEQPFKEFRERWIDHGEREYLQRLLERHGRNVPAAAEAAGLDRTYVYRLIRKHGL